MAISGFTAGTPLKVRISEGSSLAGEYEIDSNRAEFVADGIVAVLPNESGGNTKWWIPREKIDYLRQDDPVQTGGTLPAPQQSGGGTEPPQEEQPPAP